MNFFLIISSITIFLAIFSYKILTKLGIPVLLIFLCFGLCFSAIKITDINLIKDILSISLGFIIFYSGFCINWKESKKIAIPAISLSIFGVLLTAIFICLFCHYILNIDIKESFLIGSVIASTDAASIFSILHSKNSQLKENTAELLEIESGSNDPMSFVLVVMAIAILQNESINFATILFLKQIFFGVIIGFLFAKLSTYILKKTTIITYSNESLFIIAQIFLVYVFSESINANPFLALYIFGIILGNSKIQNQSALTMFFEGISKFTQIGIFFALGLLASWDGIIKIFKSGSFIFLFLTLIARPVAVFLILTIFKSSFKQILLTSIAGLRGVASIVFAIFAINSKIKLDFDLYHLVFFISLFSVAIQGTFLPIVAKRISMTDKFYDLENSFLNIQEECAIKVMNVTIPAKHFWIGKLVKDIDYFGKNAKILFIERNGQKINLNSRTKILQNDIITYTLKKLN